jgi:fibronectin type 3 domain-containing protein
MIMKKFLASLLLFSFLIGSLFACSSNDNTTGPVLQPPSIVGVQFRPDAGNTTVTLDWQMVANATSYNIYCGTDSSSLTKVSTTPAVVIGPRYTVTGLTNGKKYHFALSAVNNNGESDLSFIITAVPNDPPPPAAPTNIRFNVGDQKVTITWNPVTADPAVVSYNLHCSDFFSSGGESHITIPGQATSSYDVSTVTWNVGTNLENTAELANGTPYIFWLTAETAESANSATVLATPSDTLPISSAPSSSGDPATVPQNILATAGAGNVTVTWVAPTSATPYTSYNLYYYTIDPVHPTKIPYAVNGIVVSGLANDTSYSFYLTAFTSSSASFEVIATPSNNTLPAAPTLSTATPGDGKVTLTWTAVTGATSYNIYWSTLPEVTKTIGAATIGLPTTPLTAAVTLVNGTKYYFVVTAVNANGESMESNEMYAIPPTGP